MYVWSVCICLCGVCNIYVGYVYIFVCSVTVYVCFVYVMYIWYTYICLTKLRELFHSSLLKSVKKFLTDIDLIIPYELKLFFPDLPK